MGEFSDEDRTMLVETHTLLKAHARQMTKIADDHEDRIRVVEHKQNKIMAILSVASVGIGGALSTVWQKLIG